MINFDNAATTKIDEEILNIMEKIYKDDLGNASSVHWAGKKAFSLIQNSKQGILNTLGISNSEVIFTSGATESNNLALLGFCRGKKKGHIISVNTEHDSVLVCLEHLKKEGFEVTILSVDHNGKVNPENLRKAIRSDTILISFSIVNNETGIIQDYKSLVEVAAEKKIPVHTDAVQTFGHLKVDYSLFDMVTITSHKIYGPNGVSALIVKKGIELEPIIMGGGQQSGLRGGSENIPAIYGFARAVKKMGNKNEGEEIMTLRETLVQGLKKIDERIVINDGDGSSVPNILSFTVPEIDGAILVMNLSKEKICVSSGSACINNSNSYSHVLFAITGSEEKARNTIRISLGKRNTQEECEEFLKKFETCVEEIKSFSRKSYVNKIFNLHFTDFCNFKCYCCYVEKENKKLSLDEVKKIIDNISDYFISNGITDGRINIAGGEPTTSSYLQEIIDYIYEKKIIASLITNGILLTPDFIKRNKEKLCMIGLSIDSINRETNIKLGRCQGCKTFDYEQLVKVCRSIKENGIKLKINIVVSKVNLNEDIKPLLNEVKPDRFKILQMYPTTSFALENVVSEEEFNAYIKKYEGYNVVNEKHENLQKAYLIIDSMGYVGTENQHKDKRFNALKEPMEKILKQIDFDFKSEALRYKSNK